MSLNLSAKSFLVGLSALGFSVSASAAPLSGTYTIGGTSPSYATLSAAITALNTEGVSGPVVFNIRDGSYSGTAWRGSIGSITGASATKRITFKSETNNPANVVIKVDATASGSNYVIKLDDASYITIRGLTLANEGNTYGRVIELEGDASRDSIINCVLSSKTRTSTSVNTALVFAEDLEGGNHVFLGNTFLNNSYGAYFYGTSTANKTANNAFINNTFTNQYGFGAEIYYTDHLKFRNNVITTNSTVAFTGLETRYADGALEITGNKISGFEEGYGLYIYYSDATAATPSLIANNVITDKGGADDVEGIRNYYSSYQRIFNNTVKINSTSATSFAGYFYYSSSGYSNNQISNNVFANVGGGFALYVYNTADYNNIWDYNNLYTTGAQLARRGTPTPATDYATLTAWRAGVGQDMNSISYDPAFTSATNLAPDPANAASWSLNGRGVHLAGNNKDINGNPRVTNITLGVPDIGAYEFTPTVQPPAATPNIAPAAGQTQVFTFGQDTVATVSYAAASTVPSSITVRQYTGTVATGINTVSTTSMYFYTDIDVPAGTYDHTTNVYYKDPWMGTISYETGLRLAQKEGANPWATYNAPTSTANTERNFISTQNLTTFGSLTGIDIANNASAVQITEPLVYKCGGTHTVKLKIKNNGNNVLNNVKIDWQIDGVAQSTVSYSTALNPKAEAVVTLGSISFANGPKIVKAWTTEPNGTVDPFAEDDTITTKLRDGLNGVYTVGGVNPDYPDVKSAVSDLNQFGVCGPVTFNIRNGVYDGGLAVNTIQGGSTANRVTFKSETGVANNVNINFAATSADDNYVIQLNGASNVSFKNLTFTATGTSFARALQYIGNTSNDSVLNCRLVGPVLTALSTNTSLLFADDITGKNNVFIGNTFLNGSYGAYYRGTGTAGLADGIIFDGNTFQDQYTYAAYPYYTKNLKFNNNIVTTNSTDNTFYGIYTGYCDGPIEITRNKVSGLQGGYGIYVYYCDATATARGLVANNTVVMGAGTNSVYGLRIYNCNYQGVYNNSVHVLSGSATTSYAGYIYSSSATYEDNDVRNNVFANSGPGYAMYFYNPTYKNTSDYNNLYTAGAQLVERGTPNNDFANLSAWRAASGLEMNSISYNPGFAAATDLHPDPTKPEAWSLNGRGIHVPGNNKDMDGNTRVTALADGVPDIGAYEFIPNSVPPAAVASPATPVAGTKQIFTFGYDTVAIIDWKPNSVVPNNITVRQYTGTKAPQFPATGFMYFYTDINTQNVTYQFDASVYYKNPWAGTTGTEANVRMLKKLGSNPWRAYNGVESSTDVNRNIISANSLTSHGLFTAVDDHAIFSAIIKPASSTIFCPSGNVLLMANTGTNYSYQWQFNGANIAGATGSTYTATAAGNYTVTVTDNVNSVSSTSEPVNVTIVAPPSAPVSASGPLTLCSGNTLTLNTPAIPDFTYEWQLNGTNIPGATSASYTVSTPGSYSVTVKNIGCGTTSQLVNVTQGVSVNLGADTSFCEIAGTQLVLNAGTPGAKYTWNTGDTTQTIGVANTTGTYWVQVDAGVGCTASDTIQVQVKSLPDVIGISYVKNGNTYQFSPTGVQNATQYLWIFNDGATDNNMNATHTFSIPATEVKLVVFNECGTDTFILQIPLNVDNVNKGEILLNLYPNPARDNVSIAMEGDVYINDVAVVNQVGQIVYKENMSDKLKTKTIDVSNLPAGYYILRAGTTQGVVSRPFNIIR